jgi:hypothetical protein
MVLISVALPRAEAISLRCCSWGVASLLLIDIGGRSSATVPALVQSDHEHGCGNHGLERSHVSGVAMPSMFQVVATGWVGADLHESLSLRHFVARAACVVFER